MITTQRMIAICFIAISLFASGCGSVSTTPTPGPTPTPFPLRAADWAADWEDVTVHTLCLDVEQSYPNVDGKTPEPIFEAIRDILDGIGVQVVAMGSPCDATMTVTLIGKVSPVGYSGDFACTNWTNIDMKGEMLLSISGRNLLVKTIYESPPVDKQIGGCMYDEPKKAPFYAVWPKPILIGLGNLWGPLVSVEALGSVNSHVAEAAQQDLIDWGPAGAKEAVPALIQALRREEPWWTGSPLWVLREITGQDFGEDADRWQTWWEQQ